MSTANISIVGTHTVKPVGAPAHEGPLYMPSWDQIFGFLHVRTVHFYNPTSQEWLDTLDRSLGQALAHFSPLAGRLRWVDNTRRRLEIDCNGEGAKLVEAECDGEMSCFQGFQTEKLKRLVPEVDYEWPLEEVPLLLVQLTKFRCGGVTLGISMSHAVADGRSACHFFHEWARLSRGDPLSEAPSHDRTIFTSRQRPNDARLWSFSDHIEFQKPPVLLGKQDDERKETVKLILPLTKAQLDILKHTADSYVNDNCYGAFCGFSRYEVVATHIWRCASKARGHEYEQSTAFFITMDVRNRVQTTPIPERYFGNTILIMRAMTQAGDLISNPLGFACEKLREAVRKVNEDYIWSNFELLEKNEDLSFYLNDTRVLDINKEVIPFYTNPNIRVIDWLRLHIPDMDFGWGKRIGCIPIASDIDGSSNLLCGPGNDGSIVVLLCLQAAHADKFKRYFYEDI